MVLLMASAAGLATLGAGWVAYRAASVFWMQYADFHPRREAMPRGEAGATLREVTLRLESGTVVRGWSLPSRNGATVVFVHGSPGDRRSLLETALALHRAGYGASLIDVPGHGESTGRATWDAEALDAVRAAAAHALDAPQVRRLALVGYSMGTCVAARVAALEPRIGAVVLLAPFTDLAEQLRYQYRHRIPGLSEVAVLATRLAGVPVEEMRSLEAVRALGGRAVMIVGGGADGAIPVAMPRALYAAAREPKQLWIIERAGHTNLREVSGGAAFDERIRRFLDAALAAG